MSNILFKRKIIITKNPNFIAKNMKKIHSLKMLKTNQNGFNIKMFLFFIYTKITV